MPTNRLCLRSENDYFVAYLSEVHTFEGAIELGRIKTRLVQNKEHRASFISLMQAVVSEMIQELYGTKPSFHDESLMQAGSA